MKRMNEAASQQNELHQLIVQRERLQIQALKEQIAKQAEQNHTKLKHEKEVCITNHGIHVP